MVIHHQLLHTCLSNDPTIQKSVHDGCPGPVKRTRSMTCWRSNVKLMLKRKSIEMPSFAATLLNSSSGFFLSNGTKIERSTRAVPSVHYGALQPLRWVSSERFQSAFRYSSYHGRFCLEYHSEHIPTRQNRGVVISICTGKSETEMHSPISHLCLCLDTDRRSLYASLLRTSTYLETRPRCHFIILIMTMDCWL